MGIDAQANIEQMGAPTHQHRIKTYAEICKILNRIIYKDWEILYGMFNDRDFWLRFRFRDKNHNMWMSRKWCIDGRMTESELVQTALLAVMIAEEHETREEFKYMGVATHNPHIAISHLLNAPTDARPTT